MTMASAEPTGKGEASTPPARDGVVDALRAGSLVVVVAWHWIFSLITWSPQGPHATNPIGYTSMLWLLTWVLQPMSIFFFVGGFANARSWQSAQRRGVGPSGYLAKRLGRLLPPALVTVALGVGAVVAVRVLAPEVQWATRGVILVLSPLWFLGVYLVCVALTPISFGAHRRGGELVLVALVGVAVWADLARFRFDMPSFAWVNLLVIWGLIHQAGFALDRLRAASRQSQASVALGGLIALSALTNMGFYPRSMVGVPGEAFSNMGPPTLCIVALAAFQVGTVALLWPALTRALLRPRVKRSAVWLQANAMTLFLWHLPGYAIAWGLLTWSGWPVPSRIDGTWWVQRPVWLVAPALCTAPLLMLFRRIERR